MEDNFNKKWKFQNSEFHFFEIVNRQAPKNDEDSSHKLLKILDMGPISTKRHEMDFWWFKINLF